MTATPLVAALALGALWLLAGTAAGAQTQCGGAVTDGLPADCALEAPPLFLGFDYTSAADDDRRGTLSVTQSTAEGGLRDVTGPFDMAGQLVGPALRDLDGDDIADLVIQSRPTAFDVWLLGGEGFYRMAGRISARSLDDIEARGALTVAAMRSTDGTIIETAYLLDAGQVVTVFQMRIDPAARGCTLIDGVDASRAWLNETVLVADCEARDWN